MVRKCVVCGNTWNKNIIRSFHRFPRDIIQREIWLQNLYLVQEDLVKTKEALVCSDHFLVTDICENLSGKHVLKHNAVPTQMEDVDQKHYCKKKSCNNRKINEDSCLSTTLTTTSKVTGSNYVKIGMQDNSLERKKQDFSQLLDKTQLRLCEEDKRINPGTLKSISPPIGNLPEIDQMPLSIEEMKSVREVFQLNLEKPQQTNMFTFTNSQSVSVQPEEKCNINQGTMDGYFPSSFDIFTSRNEDVAAKELLKLKSLYKEQTKKLDCISRRNRRLKSRYEYLVNLKKLLEKKDQADNNNELSNIEVVIDEEENSVK